MFRKFTTLSLLLLLTTSIIGQTMKVSPFSVSPRKASEKATDFYTVAFNGLANVGVGTTVYLKVQLIGKRLNAPTFTSLSRPPGSNAANLFGKTTEGVDTSTTIITFTPDRPGKYEIEARDGATSGTIVINAANYIGVHTKVNNVNCSTCHETIVKQWEKTGHATSLQRAVDGVSTTHFQSFCVPCHTTGNNSAELAKNNGFDDFPFTFPTTMTAGTYDKLVADFPNAMKLANVQCEACHGPASGHMGDTRDQRISVDFDSGTCAICHDSGTHHVYPYQWDQSRHAIATNYPTGPGREACVRCHTAKGFAQFVDKVPTTDPYFDASYQPISCAACHDPHDKTNDHQLRTMSVKLANGTEIKDGGRGLLCMNCHQSRVVANDAFVAPKTSYPRFSPHYSVPADVINGKNLYLFDKTYDFSDHITSAKDGCVTCHMAEGEVDASGTIQTVGKHTFSMTTPSGKSNMKSCAPCHGYSLGASFAEVKYFPKGNGDIDMDGVVEGLQDEVYGLMKAIAKKLPVKNLDDWAHEDPTSSWTKTELMVFFNIKNIYYDGSFGIHNPAFTVGLLNECYRQVGGVVSVDENIGIPSTYEVFSNYPNPFNPTTNVKFSLPQVSQVKVTIYDALGKEVTTLVNNELAAGTHTIQWNASGMASGIYLYKVEAGNFVKVNKMMLLK